MTQKEDFFAAMQSMRSPDRAHTQGVVTCESNGAVLCSASGDKIVSYFICFFSLSYNLGMEVGDRVSFRVIRQRDSPDELGDYLDLIVTVGAQGSVS